MNKWILFFSFLFLLQTTKAQTFTGKERRAADSLLQHTRTYSFTIPQQGFFIVIFSNRSDINVEEVAEKIYHFLCPNAKPFVNIEVMTS